VPTGGDLSDGCGTDSDDFHGVNTAVDTAGTVSNRIIASIVAILIIMYLTKFAFSHAKAKAMRSDDNQYNM
jgi:hypothetical protein